MAIPLLGAVLEAGLAIIDKLIPDPQAKAAAQLRLMELQQAGEFKALEIQLALSQSQNAVNAIEAASPNPWVGGWRPAVGWVCVLALAASYLGLPLLTWASSIWHVPAPPKMDLGDLMYLLFGMLGLGTMRTVEKIKGVA